MLYAQAFQYFPRLMTIISIILFDIHATLLSEFQFEDQSCDMQ